MLGKNKSTFYGVYKHSQHFNLKYNMQISHWLYILLPLLHITFNTRNNLNIADILYMLFCDLYMLLFCVAVVFYVCTGGFNVFFSCGNFKQMS